VALFRPKAAVAEVEPTAAIEVDPLYGHPEAAELLAALEGGDWRLVDRQLSSVDDVDRREALALILSGADNVEPSVFDEWAAGHPAQGLFLRGTRSLLKAWELRTGGRAERVARSAWDPFFSTLRQAEADLLASVDRSPENEPAWSALIATGMGLQIPKSEAWARYRQATARTKNRLLAAERLLQYLCRKWQGSHDEMFDFAIATSRAAPDGHPIHRLVPMAVIERRIDCKNISEWNAEYNRPFYSRALAEAAYRSIDMETFGPRPGQGPFQLGARNIFAGAYANINDQVRLRVQLEIIGLNMTKRPWDYLGGEKEFLRLRKLTQLD
jgi:hypothetical protein